MAVERENADNPLLVLYDKRAVYAELAIGDW
jgi:hypothetical protein